MEFDSTSLPIFYDKANLNKVIPADDPADIAYSGSVVYFDLLETSEFKQRNSPGQTAVQNSFQIDPPPFYYYPECSGVLTFSFFKNDSINYFGINFEGFKE